MATKELRGVRQVDWCSGFLIALVTAIPFCYVLLTNNNALRPYYLFYGPASVVLNYQILWNNIFPQALFEAGNYAALFKIVGLISVLWVFYWGLAFGLVISFVRRKKYWAVLGVVSVVLILNCFSAMFQKWFIGMRVIM